MSDGSLDTPEAGHHFAAPSKDSNSNRYKLCCTNQDPLEYGRTFGVSCCLVSYVIYNISKFHQNPCICVGDTPGTSTVAYRVHLCPFMGSWRVLQVHSTVMKVDQRHVPGHASGPLYITVRYSLITFGVTTVHASACALYQVATSYTLFTPWGIPDVTVQKPQQNQCSVHSLNKAVEGFTRYHYEQSSSTGWPTLASYRAATPPYTQYALRSNTACAV